jgi:hypothetical protein
VLPKAFAFAEVLPTMMVEIILLSFLCDRTLLSPQLMPQNY